jgi:hypothetical protein
LGGILCHSRLSCVLHSVEQHPWTLHIRGQWYSTLNSCDQKCLQILPNFWGAKSI